METGTTEPRLSTYLHARACRTGTPLAGNFELTARCNFNCKMCYVHLTAEEQQRRGRELTADQWLAIAEQARSRGMLFLLLTGGEPLIRTDFRYLLTELKKMGLLVSVNSNGSLIALDWLDFFRHEPPFRFNITLYGGSEETYERLCGRPMYSRVTENIRALRQLGIGVKLNASMTPYNVADMEAIYGMARELEIPMQLATYMFPPIRRDEALVGCNDRFTACQAADYSVQWDRLRLEPEQFRQRAQAMKQGMALPSEDEDCQGTPGEGVMCRAGRSAFWINWQGGMTPCGMMTQPLFSVPELGFAQAWERTRAATERIRLPGACAGCRLKEVCHACAAMCVTEPGRLDVRPEYVCRMAHEALDGRFGEASALHMQMIEAIDALFEEGNPVGIKCALSCMGLIRNRLRLHLVRASESLERKMSRLIKQNEQA